MPRTRKTSRHATPDTMQYWLAGTLKEEREAHGISRREIMLLAGCEESTLSRFESGETWPQQIDRIVMAYALLCEIWDPLELWEKALQRFRAEGDPPTIQNLTPDGKVSPLTSAVLGVLDARRASMLNHERVEREVRPAAPRGKHQAGR